MRRVYGSAVDVHVLTIAVPSFGNYMLTATVRGSGNSVRDHIVLVQDSVSRVCQVKNKSEYAVPLIVSNTNRLVSAIDQRLGQVLSHGIDFADFNSLYNEEIQEHLKRIYRLNASYCETNDVRKDFPISFT